MKIATFLLLAGSLALNAALALLLLAGALAPARITPARASVATAPPAPARSLDGGVWSSLRRDDLPGLVAHLRAAGVPPTMLRAIVNAELVQEFAVRRKALDPDIDRRPYWKNVTSDANLQVELRRLDREQEKMLRTLLGDDAERDDAMSRIYQRRKMGDLPPEAAAKVKRIQLHYDELRADVSFDGSTADRMTRIAALQKQQYEAIAQTLSPSELEQYDLVAGSTANAVRSRLAAFDPSEQEFLAIYRLQRAFDDRFAGLRFVSEPTEQQTRERREAQKHLDDQIKATLGPQRFVDYQHASDFGYQTTARLVQRLEMPAQVTHDVWTVQKDILERVRLLRADVSLTDSQRAAQRAALAAEASARIGSKLGAAGLEAYTENAGWWLLELSHPRGSR